MMFVKFPSYKGSRNLKSRFTKKISSDISYVLDHIVRLGKLLRCYLFGGCGRWDVIYTPRLEVDIHVW